MMTKYCITCQQNTPHRESGKCNICLSKELVKEREKLESLALIDRIRRLEKLIESYSLGT